jgi:hypothetical protein
MRCKVGAHNQGDSSMRTLTAILSLSLTFSLGLTGCDKKKDAGGGAARTSAKANTCDDVETAMRRIEPERTADIKKGTFAQLCREQSAEWDQGRIDCVVEAELSSDLRACKDPSLRPIKPPPGATAALTARDVPLFGVKLEIPGNVTIKQNDTNTHITNGEFKLNLFRVDQYSKQSADDQKASLQKEPGFVKFTREQLGATTWSFDYELEGGKAGTSHRILVGHPLDCSIHNASPAVAQAVSAACSSAKPM